MLGNIIIAELSIIAIHVLYITLYNYINRFQEGKK